MTHRYDSMFRRPRVCVNCNNEFETQHDRRFCFTCLPPRALDIAAYDRRYVELYSKFRRQQRANRR